MSFKALPIAALALAVFAMQPARAQTEIQWWHSMTGALGERVTEIADGFNAQPEGLQGRAGLQGFLSGIDDGRDRRLPRRHGAAHRAGVRGRHGHDDERQGRHRARLPADEGIRREVRPEGLLSRGRRLLHRPQGQHAVVAVQLLDAGVLHQQGRLQEGRPRPGGGAQDLEGVRRRRRQAQGQRAGVRLHHRLAVVGAHRELQRLAQPADRHQGERHRRHGHRVQDQLAAACGAHRRCWATSRRTAGSPTPAAATRPRPSSSAANARC